jgi:hypothetical protein
MYEFITRWDNITSMNREQGAGSREQGACMDQGQVAGGAGAEC